MNENTENIRINENILVLNDDNVLYEINGVAYSLNELKAFIETSTELSRKVGRQTRFINALKLHNSELTLERNKLCDKCMAQSRELKDIKSMSMWEFADKYCSEDQLEEDGRLFARELLRTRVTGEYKDNEKAAAIAEEVFIANGEALYEATWNINCGDDY